MNQHRPSRRLSPGDLLRRQSIEELLRMIESEKEWTQNYCWYLENVLASSGKNLTPDDHQRRRHIEKLVPPARLAQWSEMAENPEEREHLYVWMQGRLDLAEHLHEQFADLLNPSDQDSEGTLLSE